MPHSGRQLEPLAKVLLQLGIDRLAVPLAWDHVGGRDADRGLDADRRGLAGVGPIEDWDAAIAIAGGLTRRLPVPFLAVLGPERQLQRRAAPDIKLARQVEIGRPLAEPRAATKNVGWARRPKGGVVVVADAKPVEGRPVFARKVPAEAGQVAALQAGRQGGVFQPAVLFRPEAIGEDRPHRLVLAGASDEIVADAVQLVVAAKGIGCDACRERILRIEEEARVAIVGLSIDPVVPVEGGLPGIQDPVRRREAGPGAEVAGREHERAARIAEILLSGVRSGAVGMPMVLIGGRKPEEPAVADLDALGGAELDILAIPRVGDPVARATNEPGALVQLDIQHTGDGVRPILRRSAVAQDFDAADRHLGNRVEVIGHVSAADLVAGIQFGVGVAAFAVDQHQDLAGREAAQGGRGQKVVRARSAWAGCAETRHRHLELALQVAGAGLGQFQTGDGVDRRGGVGHHTRAEA
ncbi:hypothetical protein GALL_500180 [mine drainage metagenome]|uniref:Uncharacterized protein n=1 Tax=mine drainage metagenome TaxID=410659 RepID=A0A1J5PAQ5_9ZZZZ